MTVQDLTVVRRHGAERALGESVANRGAVHDGSFPSFARRTLISAARSRVLTVPSGMPSASAISRAVSPRKYARAKQPPLGVRERRERAHRGVALEHHRLLVDPRPLRHLVDQDERRAGDAGLAAEPIDRQVVRDRHEPGRQPSPVGVEPRRLAPRGQEDVLGELLGRLAGAEQAHAERVHRPSEPRVDRADRDVVTGQESFHQLLFLSREERTVVPSLHPVFPSVYGAHVSARLAGHRPFDYRAPGAERCTACAPRA